MELSESGSNIKKLTEYLSQFKNEPELTRFPLPDAVFKELNIAKPLNKFEVGKLMDAVFYTSPDKIEERKTPDDIVFPPLPPVENFLEIKPIENEIVSS